MKQIKSAVKAIAVDKRCSVHQMVLAIREGKEGWIQLFGPGLFIWVVLVLVALAVVAVFACVVVCIVAVGLFSTPQPVNKTYLDNVPFSYSGAPAINLASIFL